jgi:hypothetical protein
MPNRSKAKLVDALIQGVAPGGMFWVRNVSQYVLLSSVSLFLFKEFYEATLPVEHY